MSDKRSVATDALETLGTAPIPEGSGRDAIHLAVEPIIAAEVLTPGRDVGLTPDGEGSHFAPHVGIVDPFLKKPVKRGEKFWLVVYPRQITSLRHVWSHPAFPDEQEITDEQRKFAEKVAERLTGTHEKWLREFVNNLGTDIPYEQILERASEDDGEMAFGDEITGHIPDEFWDHAEIVLGKRLTHRAGHFRCAC